MSKIPSISASDLVGGIYQPNNSDEAGKSAALSEWRRAQILTQRQNADGAGVNGKKDNQITPDEARSYVSTTKAEAHNLAQRLGISMPKSNDLSSKEMTLRAAREHKQDQSTFDQSFTKGEYDRTSLRFAYNNYKYGDLSKDEANKIYAYLVDGDLKNPQDVIGQFGDDIPNMAKLQTKYD